MRKAPLSLVLIATLAFASVANAKNRDKSWEFGLMVGNIDGDRSAEIGNGISGELRFGYNFTSKVMAELWFSDEQSEQGNTPDFGPLGLRTIPEGDCPASPIPQSHPDCFTGIFSVDPDVNKDVNFRRAILVVTGNFLTDRESRTVPFISAGLGVIQETREGYSLVTDYRVNTDHDSNPNTPRTVVDRSSSGEVLEAFDSSAILTINFGARTFFTDNWGVRYEVGYAHHNSFEANQDEYAIRLGVTWIVGGQK